MRHISDRLPGGVKEAISGVGDLEKLTAQQRAAIRCADTESLAREQ